MINDTGSNLRISLETKIFALLYCLEGVLFSVVSGERIKTPDCVGHQQTADIFCYVFLAFPCYHCSAARLLTSDMWVPRDYSGCASHLFLVFGPEMFQSYDELESVSSTVIG